MGFLVAASLAVFAVLTTHVLWWRLTARLRERGPQWCRRMLVKPTPADKRRLAMEQGRWKSVAQRGWQASRKALGWLARITLQTIAAMTLITLLQSFFRIGMLPVVELVTMTLFAEGISYMTKLRWLLHGDIGKSDAQDAAEPPFPARPRGTS